MVELRAHARAGVGMVLEQAHGELFQVGEIERAGLPLALAIETVEAAENLEQQCRAGGCRCAVIRAYCASSICSRMRLQQIVGVVAALAFVRLQVKALDGLERGERALGGDDALRAFQRGFQLLALRVIPGGERLIGGRRVSVSPISSRVTPAGTGKSASCSTRTPAPRMASYAESTASSNSKEESPRIRPRMAARCSAKQSVHRGAHGFLLQAPGFALVGDCELGVDAGEDRVFAQQAGAEAVHGGDPGALQSGARFRGCRGRPRASFLRMLPAAFSVKVMARMRSGSTPAATSWRKYSTSTVVLPEPGPATTQASRWRRATSMASS